MYKDVFIHQQYVYVLDIMKKLLTTLVLSSLTGIGFVLIGIYYSDDTIFHGFKIVGICVLLGITIKMMDLLIDEIKNKSYRIWILLLAIFKKTKNTRIH